MLYPHPLLSQICMTIHSLRNSIPINLRHRPRLCKEGGLQAYRAAQRKDLLVSEVHANGQTGQVCLYGQRRTFEISRVPAFLR